MVIYYHIKASGVYDMKNFAINIPSGARDYLGAECKLRRDIQNRLSDLFEQRGCSEVILPALEYYDTFVRSGNNIPAENMYKLIDRDGRILVLRPDLTTPIARVFATKLKNFPFPQRLYYIQSVFSSGLSNSGKDIEIFQAGVELIGMSGIRADLEAISLAVASLEECGVSNFHIEIGHSGLFKALIDELGCSDDTAEEIRRLTESKNYAALGDILEPFQGTKAASSLLKLISLFGGEEVLLESKELANGVEADRCIDYLIELQRELKSAGLADKVRYDMSLVHRINYYTGIVFQGFTEGVGEPTLTGGRYDTLTSSFGSNAPATGFGINLNALSASLEVLALIQVKELVHYNEGAFGEALRYMQSLVSGSCELSPCNTVSETMDMATRRNIERVVCIDAAGSITTREVEL